MQVYRYNARTDELISVEKLTDEVINRIAFLCGDTAAQVKAELLDGVDGDELLRRCLKAARRSMWLRAAAVPIAVCMPAIR
jgi:hypothetical protein